MADHPPKRRGFPLTPNWLVVGSLAVTGLLVLSERFQWFAFNEKKGWTVLVAVAGVGAVLLLLPVGLGLARAFRGRLQFTLRSLLVLVLAVAVPCSWFAVEVKRARQQKQLIQELGTLNAYVVYDWQCDCDGQVVAVESDQPQVPRWLWTRLGEDFFSEVDEVVFFQSRVTDAQLEHLNRLRQLKKLLLVGANITDAGLEHLQGLTTLEELDVSGTNVTDAGVKRLGKALPKCVIRH